MIVVTGATGQLGHLIVTSLIQRIPTDQICATTRDPDQAADFTELGVMVRRADFADPSSLRSAFEGATQVLLVSSNARAQGGDSVAQHGNAIAAARAAGAERIVYTSHMAASKTSAFPPMHDHAATEELLQKSGVAWTALRNGFYASSGIAMLGESIESGTLETAADGAFSWAAHADLADAAAIILTEGGFNGPTPPLTGSEALDFADLTDIASDMLGRPVVRTVLTDEAMRAKLLGRGAPERAVEMVIGLYTAARRGEFSTVDLTLEELLGRSPITMRSLMAKALG